MLFFEVFGKGRNDNRPFGMRISVDVDESMTDTDIISSVAELTGFPVHSLKRITEQEYREKYEDAEHNRDWEEDLAMQIVSPKVELLPRPYGPKDRERHVELCGRVCYKSEERIAEGTAEKFIANLIKRGHEAMLEHSRVMILVPGTSQHILQFNRIQLAMQEQGVYDYLTTSATVRGMYVSANMRAWRNFVKFAYEQDYKLPIQVWQLIRDNPAFFPEYSFPDRYKDSPDFDGSAERNPWQMSNPTVRRIHAWYSFRFTCDRGVSHEMVRHRPASFAQESTRYCNYSKGQFGGQITVIEPCFFLPDTLPYRHWKESCEAAERAYFDLLDDGCSPQQARTVLPNSLKTEIIVTATAAEWLHFLGLRMDAAAHPQMREVATQAGEMLAEVDPAVFSGPVQQIKAANNA